MGVFWVEHLGTLSFDYIIGKNETHEVEYSTRGFVVFEITTRVWGEYCDKRTKEA